MVIPVAPQRSVQLTRLAPERPVGRAARPSRATALATAGALLPPLTVALLIFTRGVDLPHWDQWELVPRLAVVAGGEWPWADLWRQHNEHRLFVPLNLMLLLSQITGWNVRAELALDFAIAVLLGAVLLAWLWRAGRRAPPLWVPPLVAAFVFNPSQVENWTWGWQLQIFLAAAGAVAALALLDGSEARPARLAGAIGCATVATFSFASGLLVWPCGLAILLTSPRGHRRRLAIWALAGLGIGVLFFTNYGLSAPPPGLASLRFLPRFVAYVTLYLAAPLLGFHARLALYGGAVALAAALFFLAQRLWRAATAGGDLRRSLLARDLPWIALAAFAFGNAALTAWGRLGFGLEQSLSSRYVTFASLFWVALLGLWLAGPRRSSRGSEALLGALAAYLLAAAAFGFDGFTGQHRWKTELREQLCASTALPPDAKLAALFPRLDALRERMETLRQLELGPFRDPACRPALPAG